MDFGELLSGFLRPHRGSLGPWCHYQGLRGSLADRVLIRASCRQILQVARSKIAHEACLKLCMLREPYSSIILEKVL